MKTTAVVFSYLLVLAVACQFAPFFGIVTMVTSFLVFSKIESDQNVYDLGFWFTHYPSAKVLSWFRAFGKLESIVRSLLLGLLAWFTFAGDDRARTLESTWLLCVAVGVSYLVLSALVRKVHLNVLRWAFVKFSVFLGVVFSTIAVTFRTTRRSLAEIAADLMGDWKVIKWITRDKPTSDGHVDRIHLLMNDAAEIFHEQLDGIIGEPFASITMIVFNSEILQGFLVVLFTFPLLLLTFPELRKRPESSKAATTAIVSGNGKNIEGGSPDSGIPAEGHGCYRKQQVEGDVSSQSD